MTQVGIIGLGRFGRLLAGILGRDFRSKRSITIRKCAALAGAAPLQEVAACETVFFCVTISSKEEALIDAAPCFTDGATVVDVCSAKRYAVEAMKRCLPDGVNILPTHPMFGPGAAANGVQELPFVLCLIDRTPAEFLRSFSKYLVTRGFRVIEMNPEEHDRVMAYSLCITQLMAALSIGSTSRRRLPIRRTFATCSGSVRCRATTHRSCFAIFRISIRTPSWVSAMPK